MNIRKIKMALTVDLINRRESNDHVDMARQTLDTFSNETGAYKGWNQIEKTFLDEKLELSVIDLEYDHCILNLEVIKDLDSKKEFLQSFNLHENLS